jgi:membrane protease YdiL (CAAX protease family)
MFTLEKPNQKFEMFATGFLILACLVLSVVFPTENSFQGISKGIFFFFVFPVLYLKFILRKKISNYGLNIKKRKAGLVWGSLMLLVSGAILHFFVSHTSFLNHYALSDLTMNSFWMFALSMLVFTNIVIFNQEFFFRGFVLSTFSQKLGFGSVFLQAALYNSAIIIGVGGFNENLWQFLPFAILSLTNGIVARKTKSIIFSWISGILFLIVANAYIIYVLKPV